MPTCRNFMVMGWKNCNLALMRSMGSVKVWISGAVPTRILMVWMRGLLVVW